MPKRPIPGFSLEEFHQHSQLTARIASEIGKKARISNAVAVAALLHDIGKLVIAERAPEHLTRAMQGVRQDRRPLYMIEEELDRSIACGSGCISAELVGATVACG